MKGKILKYFLLIPTLFFLYFSGINSRSIAEGRVIYDKKLHAVMKRFKVLRRGIYGAQRKKDFPGIIKRVKEILSKIPLLRSSKPHHGKGSLNQFKNFC